MKKLIVIVLFCLSFTGKGFAENSGTVVLVHGFMRSDANMKPVNHSIKKEGWNTVNWYYPSKEKHIEDHGKDLAIKLKEIAKENPGKPIHFVTHSMGGLVVRSALNQRSCPKEAKVGKAILLAPPNQGSAFARKVYDHRFLRWMLGKKSGKELMTTHPGGFNRLGDFPKKMQVLIMAGRYDGKVAVAETYIDTPHTHKVYPTCHCLICYCPRVLKDMKAFLASD